MEASDADRSLRSSKEALAGFAVGGIVPAMQIEVEREDDGRWIAEVSALPGAMAYGSTKAEAIMKISQKKGSEPEKGVMRSQKKGSWVDS